MKVNWKYNHFTKFFIIKIDKDPNEFKIDKNKAEQLRWISKEDLLNEIKIYPENFIELLKQIMNKNL